MSTTAEYYVAECMVKCAQAILGARIYQATKSPADRRASKWFLMQLDEVEGLRQQLQPWHRDPTHPLIIEVFMHPWAAGSLGTTAAAQPTTSTTSTTPPGSTTTELLLERWTLSFGRSMYTTAAPSSSSSTMGLGSSTGSLTGGAGAAQSRAPTDDAGLYKQLILLVRSLYCHVRVLPAYRIYRACKRHQGAMHRVGFRVYGHPAAAAAAAAGDAAGAAPPATAEPPVPPTRLQLFQFAGVELPGGAGAFTVQVEYSPKPRVHLLEQTAGNTLPAAPRIITDYMTDLESVPGASSAAAGGYPRSAPASRGGFETMFATAGAAGGGGGGGDAGSEGAAAQAGADAAAGLRLRRLQHAASQPIVRHTWSSKDMPARTVQRGFAPKGAGPSPQAADLAAAAAAAAGGGAASEAHLGRSGSAAEAAAAAGGGSSTSAPTWSGGTAPGAPSAGKPPLPHTTPPCGSASPSTPKSVPRGSGLYRMSSSSSRPPAAAAAGGYLYGISPPSRVGSWGSSGPGSGGGYSSPVQRGLHAGVGRSGRPQADPVGQQITGFATKPAPNGSSDITTPQQLQPGDMRVGDGVTSIGQSACSFGSSPTAVVGAGAAGGASSATAALAHPLQSGHRHPTPPLSPQQQRQHVEASSNSTAAADRSPGAPSGDATGVGGGGGPVGAAAALLTPSAPVMIPTSSRSRGRVRSATDLSLLTPGEAALQQGGAAEEAAAAAAGGTLQGLAVPGEGPGGRGTAVGPRRALPGGLAAAGVALAPSSAPAAPRGMLGQLLMAGKLAGSSSTSVLSSVATAAAGGAAGQPSSSRSSSSGRSDQATLQEPSAAAAAAAQGSGAAAAASGSGAAAAAVPPAQASSYPSSIIVHPAPVPGLKQAKMLQIATPANLPGPHAALSCSPQLPFAFTPSAHSVTSFGAHLFPSMGPGGTPGCPLALPSPPVSGVRDISGLATIRRPSWSSRSSSFDVAASSSMPHHLSVSPMADLLDAALLGSSAVGGPGQRPGAMAPPDVAARGPHAGSGRAVAAAAAVGVAAPAAQGGPQVAGAAAGTGDGGAAAAADVNTSDPHGMLDPFSGSGELESQPLLPEGSESDVLPFALDHEWHPQQMGAGGGDQHHGGSSSAGLHSQQQHHAGGMLPGGAGGSPGAAGGGGYHHQHPGGAGGSAAGGLGATAAGGRDVVIGAFITLLQDAPPLQLPTPAAAGAEAGVVEAQPGMGGAAAAGWGQGPEGGLTVREALVEVDHLCVRLQQLLHSR